MEKNYELITYNKPNILIRAKGQMTAIQQDLLAFSISKINSKETEFKKYYEIDINEFSELRNSDPSNAHKQVHEAARKFNKQTYVVGNETITTGILSIKTRKGSSIVEVYFDRAIEDYFFKLKGHFTKITLLSLLHIKSSHSKRIYEMLKQWQYANYLGKKKSITIKVDELKEILGVEDKYKGRIGNFETKVLAVAKDEINAVNDKGEKLTDMIMDYEKIKNGVDVEEIRFIFEILKSEDDEFHELFGQLKDNDLISEIRSNVNFNQYKFNDLQVNDLYSIAVDKTKSAAINAITYINYHLMYMDKKEKEGIKIENHFGYLKKSLERNYMNVDLNYIS